MALDKVYLSVVVTARNDNYGGDFLHHMQIFLNTLLNLAEKNRLSLELIVVEWNPPEDTPRLREELIYPGGLKFSTVQFIEVPPTLHRRLPNSECIPMFDHIAKNVGIRRAKGEYVLSTNPDVIFNEPLIQFLAAKNLSEGYFYRINRYDVASSVPLEMPVEEQLHFADKHVFKVQTIRGELPVKVSIYMFKWISQHTWAILKVNPYRDSFFKSIYAHCSGDFFLMAKSHWYKLKGYPEFGLSSHGIDAYTCFQAASSGLRQVILKKPLKLYHQEHSRLEKMQRPLINIQLYLEHIRKMMREKRPVVSNDDYWGLAKEQLKVYRVS